MIFLLLLFPVLLKLADAFPQVPADLARGFGNTPLSLNIIYGSRNITSDGSLIDRKDVTNVPTFVLKSSTNIIIDETFVALILDTTDNRARLLRYLQTGLEVTGKNGELSSSDDPKVDYQAPIAKGGQKYTFLVYPSPHGGVDFVPTKGKEPVNMQQFEEENRLGPAVAGLTANIVMDKKKPTKKAPSITSSPIEILPVPVVKIQSATPVTDVPIEILPVPIIIVDEVGKTPSTTIGRSPQVTSTSP